MISLLVTSNTGRNAGGVYAVGGALSAHRTIVSHNVGNPTGMHCDFPLPEWEHQSDPDCVCDTGDQLSCSALQRSEFYE